MLERLLRLGGERLFLYTATLLVVGLALWSALGRIDIVAHATGEVIPSSQVKSVQHLEGGIVAEILVREGQRVAADQPLLALQSISSDAQVDELGVRLTALALDVARLQAEAAGSSDLELPPALLRDHPAESQRTQALFRSRRDNYQSAIASQQKAIGQREQAVAEISARLRNTRNSLGLIDEQVRISNDLLRDNLTNRYNHLALLRDQSNLRSRMDEDAIAVRRGELAIEEARSQINGIRHAHEQEVKEQLAAALREHDELQQRSRRLSDSQSRTVLRSPVDGFVKTLHVVTQGGVIQPGKTVVDIVPADDRLIVEGRLPVYEVGHVSVGQPTRISLSSAESTRFGTIGGTVIHISPDTLVSQDSGAYYRVRVETNADHFASAGQRYQLYPGVQVDISIITGTRSVLDYLLTPFLGYADKALQER
ncbi:Type I secretion membrane fusion protein [Magnetospirillum gryphiswaldense MSR-1 v2]|uniref:Membrane fusion protein (MFP) family protein n=1 Tax=Magnetospirillum gryphiswaldense (strain DSM 6361 / JCM 21280 / NBRC 15271 / MSR-1) TaxID=431944 RepID=V6F325_MAGGM|nr:HlyD family type I secretion periplasmic adaptor subunit [Magnetospirillum gryphiswaldense]CDK99935.1 Type I secretion membrane fusion protein [Magnetospirillum gryphiswaldense MSR-1 v2]